MPRPAVNNNNRANQISQNKTVFTPGKMGASIRQLQLPRLQLPNWRACVLTSTQNPPASSYVQQPSRWSSPGLEWKFQPQVSVRILPLPLRLSPRPDLGLLQYPLSI